MPELKMDRGVWMILIMLALNSCGRVSDEFYRNYQTKTPQNDSLYKAFFENRPLDSLDYQKLRKSILDFENRLKAEIKAVDSIDRLFILPATKREKMVNHYRESNSQREINLLYHRVKRAFEAIPTYQFTASLPDTLALGEMPLKLLNGILTAELAEIKLKERAILKKRLQLKDSTLN